MTLPELLVIRHGETEWNRIKRMQGTLDSPLTPKGQGQARAIGALLAQLGVSAQSHDIRTSPQGRSVATATLALGGLGLTAREDADLVEMSVGVWSGLTMDALIERGEGPLPEETALEYCSRAPEGEGLEAAWERTGRVLASITRPTILFTHGLTSRILRTRAMGWEPDRLEELPSGQGVIFRLAGGRHDTLAPPENAA